MFSIDISFIFTYIPILILISCYMVIGGVSLHYSKKYVLNKKMGNLPFISIVLPTYNEANIITDRLSNLLDVEYPRNKMEIIITDSSNDQTHILIQQFIKEHPTLNIKLIHDDVRRGLAIALNKAYKRCKGEIIVKIDSDLRLSKDSLINIISNFNDPRIGAVTGKMFLLNTKNEEANYRSMQDVIQRAESYIDSIYMAHPFSAYRRALIREYKPYHYGDETIQTIHIRREGYKVIYDPSAVFYEYIPDDSKELLKQKIRRAEGHIGILLENIDMLFNPTFKKFGLYVYPSNFFMLIISPILLLLTIIFVSIDLIIFRSTLFYDLILLGLLGLIIFGRKVRYINPIYTFIELQYSQLMAIFNVIRGKRDHMWTKITRVEDQLSK